MSYQLLAQGIAQELGVINARLEHLNKKLEEWLNAGHKDAMFVKVFREGNPVFTGSYGTDRPNGEGKPVAGDTIFPVASMTKPIIATLLLSLQEDGELDLVSPIKCFVPRTNGTQIGERTLLQFLTHTSGVNDEELHRDSIRYINEELGIKTPKNGSDSDTRDVWQDVMNKAGKKLGLSKEDDVWEYIRFHKVDIKEPSKYMSYCNIGYGLLREAVCFVSKQSIDEIARERIFDPLGMKDTHFIMPQEKWERVIRRAEGTDGYPWQNSEQCFTSESGSGGLKTTADDYIKFCEMIRNFGTYNGARVLSRISVETLWRDHNANLSKTDPYTSWAIGFNYRGTKFDDTGMLRPDSCIDHGGWGGTKAVIDKENGISAVMMTVHRSNAHILFNYIMNIIYSSLI